MSSSWPDELNKVFEMALARYDKGAPDFWQNVARAVGEGKTVDDVKEHFKVLTEDVDDMEIMYGGRSSNKSKGGSSSGEQRLKHHKPQ
ncbi:unnamed protein product [Urochloa decumbens]